MCGSVRKRDQLPDTRVPEFSLSAAAAAVPSVGIKEDGSGAWKKSNRVEGVAGKETDGI